MLVQYTVCAERRVSDSETWCEYRYQWTGNGHISGRYRYRIVLRFSIATLVQEILEGFEFNATSTAGLCK
jgi:hypothetical protein